MRKIFLGISLPFLGILGWLAFGAYLQNTVPKVELQTVSNLAVQGEKTLPFYELMSPLPPLNSMVLPKLEYKKGPPDRFIERISILIQKNSSAPKERIIYYGRRSESPSFGLRFFPELPNKEALFLESAILYSQRGELPAYCADASLFLLKPFLLLKAKELLRNVERVSIMDQSGTPAFLFDSIQGERSRSVALFTRRNSSYKIEFIGDQGFRELRPTEIFRKTFLTERRSDAMEYLAKNLSQVQLGSNSGPMEIRDIAWPILLVAANISVDPSSLEGFFHFAGISALLYKNALKARGDVETIDILRNNVLASEFYAKDISPDAAQTSEISRLARLLTRNFDQ